MWKPSNLFVSLNLFCASRLEMSFTVTIKWDLIGILSWFQRPVKVCLNTILFISLSFSYIKLVLQLDLLWLLLYKMIKVFDVVIICHIFKIIVTWGRVLFILIIYYYALFYKIIDNGFILESRTCYIRFLSNSWFITIAIG